MTWKDNLRKASWKGQEFWWMDATTTIDPMVVVHKYPQRKGGWSEDLGLGPDEFEIVGYVIGPEYMAARDALIRACKEGGPGTLVHPTLGEKTVVVKPPVRIQESTREGGMARFTLVFSEEGENKYPQEKVSASGGVAEASAAAWTVAADDFAAGFDTAGQDMLEADAVAALGAVSTAIADAFGGVGGVMRQASLGFDVVAAPLAIAQDGLGLTASSLSAFRDLVGRPLALVRDARGLAAGLGSVFGGLSSFWSGRASAAHALTALAGVGGKIPRAAVTPSTAPQDANRAALSLLVRRQVAIAAAETAAGAEYESRDDAVAARDRAVALIDAARLDDGATGEVFAALTDLRAVAVKATGEKAGTLASLRSFEMGDTLPAALVAYRELGDAKRADELVARNRAQIWNPLFVPAGATIEVVDG